MSLASSSPGGRSSGTSIRPRGRQGPAASPAATSGAPSGPSYSATAASAPSALWPNFMASFGDVFGLGFAIEGISFFLEAIFIGVYIYGWGRLSPRAHFLAGFPIVITGFTGSFMVIAVNGWMNHPTGFSVRGGQVVDVHPFKALFENSYFWHELLHMYLA